MYKHRRGRRAAGLAASHKCHRWGRAGRL